MEYKDTPIQWTEDQWNLVQQAVRDEARKVRVAASFLPLQGPLPAEVESVPIQRVDSEGTSEPNFFLTALKRRFREQGLRVGHANPREFMDAFIQSLEFEEPEYARSRQRGEPRQRLLVDDHTTRPLTTIAVNVYLRRAQIAQPDLSSALIMLRRAANIIARVEDNIVFGGQPQRDPTPDQFRVRPQIFNVTGGAAFSGLVDSARHTVSTVPRNEETQGEALVRIVAEGISRLEGFGHLAPFALVLGSNLFVDVHTPDEGSLVLPADRIKPLLDGPLLRTSTIDEDRGVLLSLAGDVVDLVVASDICVQFLQVTMEPRYVCRVSQRFTVRVKQPEAIVSLGPQLPEDEDLVEQKEPPDEDQLRGKKAPKTE